MIIPMIIQTIGLDPSGAVWTDEASNLSSLDPSGAIQIDAEHPSRNRKVVGSNPTLGLQNRRSEAISGIADCAAAASGHSFGLDQRATGAPSQRLPFHYAP
ncbi:MAG TPA: hypothetical protein VK942_14470 [Actinomycetes bacterium]|nr:hypothetical protein [Actinomycetes bacterium]